jgi:hypothetical protein
MRPLGFQTVDQLDVALAPDTLPFVRCEANHVALCVAGLPDAIDPADAQGFIDVSFQVTEGFLLAFL